MKNLCRDISVDDMNKTLAKAKYLKNLSYITIIADIVGFFSMEILKFAYCKDIDFIGELYFLLGKVNKAN